MSVSDQRIEELAEKYVRVLRADNGVVSYSHLALRECVSKVRMESEPEEADDNQTRLYDAIHNKLIGW